MAYKAFNRLINCEVGAGAIELPISKPNILSKVCNSIESRLGCRIVILLGLCALEVVIKGLFGNFFWPGQIGQVDIH